MNYEFHVTTMDVTDMNFHSLTETTFGHKSSSSNTARAGFWDKTTAPTYDLLITIQVNNTTIT